MALQQSDLPAGGFHALSKVEQAYICRQLQIELKLPRTPTVVQARALVEALDAGRFGFTAPVFLGGAMAGGKTAWACMLAIGLAQRVKRNRVLICRKEYSTLVGSTVQELEEQLMDVPGAKHWPGKHEVHFPNGSEIWYMGVGVPRQRQKLGSYQFGAIIIEESPEVDYDVFKMLQTRLRLSTAERAGLLVLAMTGNPYPGWVKEMFVTAKRKNYRYIGATVYDNPHVYAQYAEHMKQEMDPVFFRAMVLGDWDALVSADQVAPDRLVATAQRQWGRVAPQDDYVIWGVDIGTTGRDASQIMRRRGYVWDSVAELPKGTVPENTRWLIDQYHDATLQPRAINIDADGIGAAVAHEMLEVQEAGDLPDAPILIINSVHSGGGKVKDRDGISYSSQRGLMAFRFTQILQAGVAAIEEDQDVFAELTTPTYRLDGGMIVIEPKEVTKRRLGHSPNKADAIYYTCYDDLEAEYVEIAGLPDDLDEYVNHHPELDDDAELTMLIAAQRRKERYTRMLGRDAFSEYDI